MPPLNFFIDIHCHPNYKPFARAHRQSGRVPGPQGPSTNQRSSLWYYDPPVLTDKLANYFLSITKFRQHNLTAALYGRLLVMAVGLGSVEKFFFKNKIGSGIISDLVDDFVSEFGTPRINTIQRMKDYWSDFRREMKFMEEQEGQPVRIDGHWYLYRLVKDFGDLQNCIQANEADNAGLQKEQPLIISIIPSIEGLHILNCGLENPCDPSVVKANARSLKKMKNVPWFVTFSHHFYNELCGHARSLRKQIGKLTNQEEGINTGFTKLGREVLDILLSPTGGRRILIDIKHMSAVARKEFFAIRSNKYNDSFPIIISHGVCNGLPTLGATVSNYPELGNTFINPQEEARGGDGQYKDHNLINFFDDEILEMVRSGGIIGLQLDERRIANDETIRKVKHSVHRNKIMHYRSALLWKQVQYIAELLDDHGLYAWGNMAIGSDYDGLVDPLNAFWTAEEFDDLAAFFERHAYNYFKDQPGRIKHAINKLSADQVVQQIFRENAWQFLKRWF
ncbi:MAG: peptidase M19 [Terrimonas sp.]|nr:peptidase M19 [Terrimonas sp.]